MVIGRSFEQTYPISKNNNFSFRENFSAKLTAAVLTGRAAPHLASRPPPGPRAAAGRGSGGDRHTAHDGRQRGLGV